MRFWPRKKKKVQSKQLLPGQAGRRAIRREGLRKETKRDSQGRMDYGLEDSTVEVEICRLHCERPRILVVSARRFGEEGKRGT